MKIDRLLALLEQKAAGLQGWKGLTVRSSDLASKLLQLAGPLTRAEIAAALAVYQGQDVHLSVGASIPCWRFQGTAASEGFVPIWIETWGSDFLNGAGRLRVIEGDASFGIADSGPFIALLQPENDPHVAAVNRRVEENLERATDIILAIAGEGSLALKTFSAQGLYQPLNAHLVFFREPGALIADLMLLKELWYNGLPGYRTEPLSHSVERPDRYALHPWRGLEASRALAVRLSDLIDRANTVTAATIEQFDWERYDTFNGKPGRAVLDYPFWVNNFLDHLYLDLLAA